MPRLEGDTARAGRCSVPPRAGELGVSGRSWKKQKTSRSSRSQDSLTAIFLATLAFPIKPSATQNSPKYLSPSKKGC